MLLIQDDYVIEQVSPAVSNPTFGYAVLPRTPEAGPLRCDAEAFDCFDDFRVEVRASIKNQKLRGRIKRERFAQLLDDPSAGWMPCNVVLQNTSAIMRDNEEAVQHSEVDRRDGEEVHCGDNFTVVAEKRRPSFRQPWISRSLSNPARHGSLRDVETEHHQLAVHSRRTPGRILGHHAEDHVTKLLGDTLSPSSSAMSREPRPVQFESCPMPSHDRLRLHEHQGTFPSRPKSPQHDPEQLVWKCEFRPWTLRIQDGKLLAKSKNLENQARPRT